MRNSIKQDLFSKIQKLEKIFKKGNNVDKQISLLRFVIFLVGITFCLISFFFISDLAMVLSFVFFATIFSIIAHKHSTHLRKLNRMKEWINLQKNNLARINLDWDVIPSVTIGEKDVHPVEHDLNMIGDKSILHLISTCTTVEGLRILRKQLLTLEPKLEDVNDRQKIVKEVTNLNRFRERLLLVSSMTKNKENSSTKVIEWLKSYNAEKELFRIFVFMTSFALVNFALILLYYFDILPRYWVISAPLYLLLYYYLYRKVGVSFNNAEMIKREIGKYSVVYDFLEKYRYKKDSFLSKLVSPIINSQETPSKVFASVNSSLEILSLRTNPYIWFMIAMVFPLDYFLGYRIEKKKNILSEKLEEWLSVWHNLEAINSLANFAYLNPEYSFPKIMTGNSETSVLSVENLGHPLIEKSKKVKNDFSINSLDDLFIITGSNMSGKSTFLRSIGVNLLLAYSGAPVDSKSFSVHLIKLFTCINVSDSVVDGISYFYAEVRRLKQLITQVNDSNDLPILFLIDEIFKGTNNIERLKGSQAYVKWLLNKNVTGIIATHDLELTNLAKDFNQIRNYHFREDVEDNRMVFDYKIHQGPCPTTNALRIMEYEGLPI
ncbi:MAG: hypothetical protein KKA84_13005 [Bacteroidetes bacterium]|nr:hypothetical protein [Bacteroidota bacterium]